MKGREWSLFFFEEVEKSSEVPVVGFTVVSLVVVDSGAFSVAENEGVGFATILSRSTMAWEEVSEDASDPTFEVLETGALVFGLGTDWCVGEVFISASDPEPAGLCLAGRREWGSFGEVEEVESALHPLG